MKLQLDEEASALLRSLIDSGTPEEVSQVTLFVGESLDDDGRPVHGLHAYQTEHPEEGLTPLVEFAPLAALPDVPTLAMLEAVLKAHPGALSGYAVNFINDWKVAVAAYRAQVASSLQSSAVIHQPGTSCRVQNDAGQCGCPWGQCALNRPHVQPQAPVSAQIQGHPPVTLHHLGCACTFPTRANGGKCDCGVAGGLGGPNVC
jgi:hypothetical protein